MEESSIIVHKVDLDDYDGEDWIVPRLTRGNRVDIYEGGDLHRVAQVIGLIEDLGAGEAVVVWRNI